MATHTLSILKPSVNNLSVRVFVRAAGLDHEEVDMWGNKGTPEFLKKNPSDLTPLLEEEGLPKGSLWESCAIMQYLCNRDGLDQFYPSDPGKRAMVDSAMFYLVGTIYPLVARATYPTLGFPQYAGEVGHLRGRGRDQGEGGKGRRGGPRGAPRGLQRVVPGRQGRFVGGAKSPTIADIRLAVTLEFLDSIDYDMPKWASDHKQAVEDALGDAYSEPASEVREFVASTKG